jgi:hypothetical protein
MEPAYRIWGVDGVVYGPVDLPTLIGWVEEERVLTSTWLFGDHTDRWSKAGDLAELADFFAGAHARPEAAYETSMLSQVPGMKPGSLRRIKIFASFSDEQLGRFMQYIELKKVRQFTEIVRQGDPGDAMFFIIDGEVRVRLMIGGKESTLTTLTIGEFFGEMTLFDHGTRSADVLANTETALLRLSAASFQKLVDNAPDLAAPFLLAIGKTLTSRIRADNKRFRESVALARSSR